MPATMTKMTAELPAGAAVDSALAGLLAEQEIHGYRPYAGMLGSGVIGEWQSRRARAAVDASPGFVCVRKFGATVGAGLWKHLAWDTQMLGLSAGRIDFLVARGDYAVAVQRKREIAHAIIDEAGSHSVRHLSVRVDSGDLSGLHALQKAGFEIVDGIQTFALTLPAPQAAAHTGVITAGLFEPADLDGVLAIARSAYQFDRFHADPALDPGVADALHEHWVRNSCLGLAADAVIVARRANQVLGFVTVKIDRELGASSPVKMATIVLVATSEEARGKGVARLATAAALEWAASEQVRVVQVGTQLRNVPAARLYESCGFRQVATSLTLRALL